MNRTKLSTQSTVKRNVESPCERVRDGLAKTGKGKPSRSRKRIRTLVPVPGDIGLVLELVNLLPGEFRHPHWARRSSIKPGSKSARYQRDILEWEKGSESREAALMAYIEHIGEVPDEWQENTYDLLFYKMKHLLNELPLALQAFILRDEQGRLVQTKECSERVESGLESSLQALCNYELLNKDEAELREVIEHALQRIESSFKIEKEAQTPAARLETQFRKPSDEFAFVSADQLLERARQRFLFVLASQEFVSCLTHPNSGYELFFRHVSRISDATHCTPYVVANGPKKGTVALGPAPLYGFFVGVEAARIRECPICFKFFWAGRKDMTGCSTKCSNAHRMRKYRRMENNNVKAKTK